ncbi:unnamed protein product, partial [Mesorhabditis spiculigera]
MAEIALELDIPVEHVLSPWAPMIPARNTLLIRLAMGKSGCVRQTKMTSICVENHYPECSNEVDDGVVEFNVDDEQFEVGLDATHFGPDDITMKITGRTVELVFETKLKLDDAGVVVRKEARRYELPDEVNPLSITGKLIHHTYYVRGLMYSTHDQ